MIGKAITTIVLLFVGFAVVFPMLNAPSDKVSAGVGSSQETVVHESIDPVAKAMLGVSISDYTWRKGGFDTVAIANFVISNKNDFAVRDIKVECTFSAQSGTVLSRLSETIYKSFPAKKKTSAKEVSLGFINPQVERASCDLVDLSL